VTRREGEGETVAEELLCAKAETENSENDVMIVRHFMAEE